MDECLTSYEYKYSSTLLEGKVAFITGGGTGIGFRITELLMRHGANCAIASRNIDKLRTSSRKLEKATQKRCLPIQMDVRKYDQVTQAVDRIVNEFGNIDILVNNAAGNFISPVSSLSSNAFKTVIEIDLLGTFNVSRAVYTKCFTQAGSKGVILNISAVLYHTGTPLQSHAGAAKAGVDALTNHLAVEWGPDGVRVNSLAPGPINETVGFTKLLGGGSKVMEFINDSLPLGRMGTKKEVAEAALFLVSSLSSFTTGTLMFVDGGSRLTSGRTMQASLNMFSKL